MKILVTGGSGLVGKSIETIKNNYKDYEFIFISSKDCDLLNFDKTNTLFENIKPDFVIHLAAYVGGLFKNMTHKVDMYEKNVLINMNVLKCCHNHNVIKVVSCLSTCVFPDKVKYPIDEKMLHTGEPHNSNYGYAYAKRMLDIQSKLYRDQYNDNFICVIPTNIYGEHDNYSLEDGHVIPALIHQCYLSKQNNKPFVVKGSGKPLRQFIYSKNLAELILWSLLEYNKSENIILSVGENDETSIRDVAIEISKAFNYENNIIFDTQYSDGQYKKTSNNSLLMKYNKKYVFTNLEEGIKNSVDWFNENYFNCRK
jgi:GDP-L-fucose synthase